MSNSISIDEAGYVYIYLSNEEDTPIDVFFDDLVIEHTHTKIVSKDDYYPFGLTFNSYQKAASTEQRIKYNGKEQIDDLGLNMADFGARLYQPDLGRWTVIDAKAEKYGNMSPYHYAVNNPVIFIDPDGNDAVVVITGVVVDNPGSLGSEHRGTYKMYQVNIYENMTLDQYNAARRAGNLGDPTSTTMLSRDAWNDASRSKGKYGYGKNNEAPPGTYWLNYREAGFGTKKHKMRLSDDKGGHTIQGPEGKRKGIDIHFYSPHFAQGCFTTGSNDICSEYDFMNQLPSLVRGEDVRVIVQPRTAEWNKEEGRWEGTKAESTESTNEEEGEADYSEFWNNLLKKAMEFINSDD